MSDTSKSINNIKKDLDRISGLTGFVSCQIEILEHLIHVYVEGILREAEKEEDNEHE